MAKSAVGTASNKKVFKRSIGKRTSIGQSANSRPKAKHLKAGFKKYRGQGKAR
jgi:hypothetical protein